MSDTFQNRADHVSGPATRCVAVTPHDSNALNGIPKGLYVGSGGDVVIEAAPGDAAVTLKNVGDGAVLPVRARVVRATGTTAADIVALY